MSRRRHRLAHLAAACLTLLLALPSRAAALDLGWTALGGWQGGGVLRIGALLARPFGKAPVGLELAVGHAFIDPGDAALARSVFINDATDGTPEESGGVWDLRADGILWLKVAGLSEVGVTGGVRYSMYSGRFKYVGGNEDFTITSDAWGLGVGARASLPLNKRVSFTAVAGLDWFPTQTLYGHDTSYASDGEIVNGRLAYRWRDADRSVNQPWLLPSLLVGVSWK